VGTDLFGAPEMEIFPPWGRGWREKLPRGDFGAGIGEEASVSVDSSNMSITSFYFFYIFENSRYLFYYALWDILVMSLYDYAYFAMHFGIFWLWGFVWLLVLKYFCIVFWFWMHYVLFLFFKKKMIIFVFLIKRENIAS
jgi:hypothetical protein